MDHSHHSHDMHHSPDMHHSHDMQHSHEMHHTDSSGHKHDQLKPSGSEMCMVENRELEIYDKLSPTQIATHVWETCKPRSSFMMKKPSVSARRAQLMRLHLLNKTEPCPGKDAEGASLDEKQSGMSKQNTSKQSSKAQMTKCPKKRTPCDSESSEENDIAYACPSECNLEQEKDYEGEEDEDEGDDEEGGKNCTY